MISLASIDVIRQQARSALKWAFFLPPMAAAVGSACAFFLWSLDAVAHVRIGHPYLLYFLPIAGVALGLVYHHFGRSAEGGTNLLMDEIHEPGGGVPIRMAPLILLGTLVTHLFGGSAGREGTAVQMGGSIASAFCRMLRPDPGSVRIMLMCGISAGFGAVFGTPLAGAIFALEVLVIGRVEYGALLPCLMASIIGDWTCHAWGIGHTHYGIQYLANALPPASFFHLEPLLIAKVAVVGVACGLVSAIFAEASHSLAAFYKRWIAYPPLRPLVGGAVVIALYHLSGTSDYLGLGVSSSDPQAITIVSFFHSQDVHPWSWLWKMIFTIATLSAGFKGGEVTPLFFIGAALGNALGGVLGAPLDLFAAIGFVAVFAGATNTPLACTLMGIELFGATHSVYLALACFIAYMCSGHNSIYAAQRLGTAKAHSANTRLGIRMRELREAPNPETVGDPDKTSQ